MGRLAPVDRLVGSAEIHLLDGLIVIGGEGTLSTTWRWQHPHVESFGGQLR
jgi:hypothetical protein